MSTQKSFINNMPTVYLVSTPIGNIEDITYRAIKILSTVDIIFSEDTRETKNLLNHYGINKKLISSHKFNEKENIEKIKELLIDNKDIAIVSDRGTPLISDPGYILTSTAIEKGYNVVAIPGPTALIPALITSGIETQPFLFYGFLKERDSKVKKELSLLENLEYTIILYESPHRLTKTLKNMLEVFGNRKISISREITKKFEEIYRGTLEDSLTAFDVIKGEFVIVVEKNLNKKQQFNNLTILEHVNLYVEEGKTVKDSIKLVSQERNISKNVVYDEYHKKGEA